MTTDKSATVSLLPIIKHSFRAGLWKAAYSLTWDWDNRRWIETLEPERGKASTWQEVVNGGR